MTSNGSDAPSAGNNMTESIFLTYNMMTFHEKFAPASVMIDRSISPIFYIIGVFCNPLSAYIWLNRKTRRNNSSAIYLGTLSISHFVFLILHIFVELNYAWGIKTYNGPISCEIFNVIYYVPQYMAPLLVLSFTVERYIAVCHPFSKEKFCTVRRAIIAVVILYISSMLLSVIQGYFWTYNPSLGDCDHRVEARLGGQTSIINVWTWISELLIFAIVPLAALVFNIFVINEIKSLTKRGPAYQQPGSGSPTASTVTLLTVSFYLICTWLPATLVYSLQNLFMANDRMTAEEIRADPEWRSYFIYITIRKAIEEITLSNSACYFFIYCITGKHFRDQVCALFGLQKCVRSEEVPPPTYKQYMAVAKIDHVTNGHTSITSV
ncbi:probable G-protein coupled receptor 139 [Haliotis asinina]|uniref:probable G-protein coupled receptor 139 n=1 Tax=Haliotis asinina TaxID=109174 RepID=UPI0035327657